jgi:hypothetical protein
MNVKVTLKHCNKDGKFLTKTFVNARFSTDKVFGQEHNNRYERTGELWIVDAMPNGGQSIRAVFPQGEYICAEYVHLDG